MRLTEALGQAQNIFTQNFCCHWYQHISPGWTTKYGHRAKWFELPFCTVSLLISTWSWSSRKCNIWNVLASHYCPTKSLCALYPQTNNFTPAKGGGGCFGSRGGWSERLKGAESGGRVLPVALAVMPRASKVALSTELSAPQLFNDISLSPNCLWPASHRLIGKSYMAKAQELTLILFQENI